ncbi:MAG: hypothetical protein AB7V00_03735 [Bacilli bacterium]
MKKTIFQKLIMMIMVAIMLVIVVKFPSNDNNSASGYDYSLSNYWDGSSLSIDALDTTSFDSLYVPFSTINNNPSAINPAKRYVISTAMDLYNFSVNAKGTDKATYLNLYYVLGNDINFDDASTSGYLIYPIGFATTHPFTGTFDGQGFSISNLLFEPVSSETEYSDVYQNDLIYYSLFSRIGSTGVVKNLGLINATMIQPINWGVMSYASPLAGLNQGTIDHVFVIDNRTDAGLSVDGEFQLSGMVSVNQGTFTNSFLSTRFVKSEAVINNLVVNTVVNSNSGTLTNVYYDDTVLIPTPPVGDLGTALTTADFQNPTYFGSGWYLNNYYSQTNPQALLSNTYPILKSIDYDVNNQFLISNALELLYMEELLATSSYFRNKTYLITQDIDMNQVSFGAYQTPNIDFSGTFSSQPIISPETTTLYAHSSTEGAVGYYSIISLSMNIGRVIGTYTSYGLFGVTSGTISNINLINALIQTDDIADHVAKIRSNIGFATGYLNNGTISNVHVLGSISVPNTEQIGKIYLGGLVGYGQGSIINSSTSGTIDGGIHPYHENSSQSAIGGLIGYSVKTSISQSINAINITGLSFSETNTSVLYLGGLIGVGVTDGFTEVINRGNVLSNHQDGHIYQIYQGGAIGLHTQELLTTSRINNEGNVTIVTKEALVAKVAGYGNVIGSNNFVYYSLTNLGIVGNSFVNGTNLLTAAILETIKLEMAGVVITEGTNAYFQGLYNKANFTLDLSVCNNFAGIILSNNNYTLVGGLPVYDDVSFSYGSSVTIVQSYNEGNINAITTGEVTSYQIKISGNSLGKNINFDQLRNEGDISVHFSHQTTKLMKDAPDADGVVTPYKNLKVMGLIEEISQDKLATNLYNGGKISITMNTGLKVKFNLYISGIAYKNANTNLFTTNNIDYTSIDIDPSVQGSIHNALNDGEIYSVGEFYGQSRVSGIVSINASMLSSCFNTGNIYNENAIKTKAFYADDDNYSAGEFEVETAGITFLMNGQYSQIKDSANYGTITSYATTTSGWVNASGIALRNEKTENGTDYGSSPVSGSHFGKIQFSINYGNVFAWNPVDEASYGVNNESRCKAAGILALGVLSTINVLNYGNVYSRYVASGMYGFVFFQKFTIGVNEVFIANSINYGEIRRLISTGTGTGCPFYYDATTQSTLVPTNYVQQDYVTKISTNTEYAFGALIGKIHTGASTGWVFTSGTYSIRNVVFSYLINFDEISDIIGKAPTSTSTDETLVASINQYMATVRLSDGSIYPFDRIKSYSLDTAPLTGQTGRNGTTYMGIFNEAFSLRTPPTTFNFDTDQFIADYIQFIPYSKVNSALAQRINLDDIGELEGDEVGIYALSSATGILNGEFIPDNMNLSGLNPHLFDENGFVISDDSWQNVINSGTETAYNKFYIGMKQLIKSIASTVFDMELVCDQDPSIIIRDPVIDQSSKLVTFYVASNSDAALGSTFTPKTLTSYTEAAQGITGAIFVPDTYNSTTGKYVGTYKKNLDNSYSTIGPYNSLGNYNVTFTSYTSRTYNTYTRSTNTYLDANGVSYYLYSYNNNPYSKITGYRISTYSLTTAGYGRYRQISSTNYAYVGPTAEDPTYVRTNFSGGVYSDNGKTFSINLDGNTYQLAQKASLYYNYNDQNYLYSGNTGASIPVLSGIYGDVYDGGTLISPMSDFYGLVRTYAEAYEYDPLDESNDPYTFSDYNIRIVRVADQSFTALNSLYVNGLDAKPLSIPNLNDITATVALAYKPSGDDGTASFTYVTNNIANLANLLPVTSFTDGVGNPIDPSLYSLTGGVVTTSGTFNPITGFWGDGLVSFSLSTTQELPSGNYKVSIALSSFDVYTINLSKEESPEASVLSLVFNNQIVTIPSLQTSYVSDIPYGIYYLSTDSQTNIVNFANLSSISNVYYDSLTGSNLPSYLGAIEISPYATLVSINFSVSLYDTYRHQYAITYNIAAEDGTTATFTHYLLEKTVDTNVIESFVDGNIVEEEPYNVIGFDREDSPTIRLNFNFVNIYIPNALFLSITPTFLGSGTATEDIDYFIEAFSSYGFEVDFSASAPVGEYQFAMSYTHSEEILPGNTASWNLAFQSVSITKRLNNNSHLTQINFVTDTVYTGLDTVMDIVELTGTTYQDYLDDRTTREIIILPTSGISYNDYWDYQAYWVIGQVQRTNLNYYAPTFTLPLGASIYRVIDEVNANDPSLQSTNYYADFNASGDISTFNFIHYRVYAEDYEMNNPAYNTHYTDYYVAVQDVTNNIRFEITVEIDDAITPIIFDKLFITLNIDDGIDMTTSMSLFAYFYQIDYLGTHVQFNSSMSGQYTVVIDLPTEYGFTLSFASPDVVVVDGGFYIANTIIPKKYEFTITIIESGLSDAWGQRLVSNYDDSII